MIQADMTKRSSEYLFPMLDPLPTRSMVGSSEYYTPMLPCCNSSCSSSIWYKHDFNPATCYLKCRAVTLTSRASFTESHRTSSFFLTLPYHPWPRVKAFPRQGLRSHPTWWGFRSPLQPRASCSQVPFPLPLFLAEGCSRDILANRDYLTQARCSACL